MRENFEPSLERVLVHEGGYSNHQDDPGGATLEGVIQRTYDSYRKRKGLPRKRLSPDMRGTPEWIAERNEIYRLQYWNVIKGDELPSGIDYVVFDGAVNSGPVQSVKWLQRALGVRADGAVGEVTLRAIENYPDHDRLVQEICDRRLQFLRALRTWKTFGKGWTRRVKDVEEAGMAWARGALAMEPVYVAGGEANATIADAKKPPSTSIAGATSGGGAITTALSQAQSAIEPHTGTSDTMALIYTVLTIVGILATVGGIVWVMWAQKKKADLENALDIRTELPPGAVEEGAHV